MEIAEYFSFLPYGKYAFYIWTSYLITFVVLGVLLFTSSRLHKHTMQKLQAKYQRDQQYHD